MDFHLAYSIITIILSICIFVYSWQNPQARGSREFAYLCLSAILWMSGVLLGKISSTFAGQYLSDVIRFAGVMPLPVALFVFTRRYCDRKVSKKQLLYLSIIPITSFLLMATTYWHKIFFSKMEFAAGETLAVEYGMYFWFIHTPYSYALIIISIFIVLIELTRTTQRFRSQIIFLFISICFPFGVNFAHLAGVFNEVNLTPISFLGFMTVSAIGIFRYQFLSTAPIAYETVFKTSRDRVVILDSKNLIADINPAAAAELKKSPKELVGICLKTALSSCPKIWEKYNEEIKLHDEFEIELAESERFFSVSAIPIDNGNGVINGRILTIRDITSNKQHQISLETLAFHDPLTMLANRRKFNKVFLETVKQSKLTKETFAILYFDLNSFKKVNDSLGHDIGDELLKYVAARIASILRTPDIVARLGGDEFAAILHNTNERGVETAVERIIENTQKPFKVKNHTLSAHLSIGAAFYPRHGDELIALLNHADTAMYRAKSMGGGLAIFDSNFDSTKILNM